MRLLEPRDMGRRVREHEVAALAEVAVDRLIGDELLDERVRGERIPP